MGLPSDRIGWKAACGRTRREDFAPLERGHLELDHVIAGDLQFLQRGQHEFRVLVGLLDTLGQLEQLAEEAGAADEGLAHVVAHGDLFDDVGHRDAEQDVHQRHDADREADVGHRALAGTQALGQQLHQAAAGRREHQQRRLVVAARGRLRVQHDLQPALQLAPAQHEQRLADGIDALRGTDGRRVHEAQQVQRQRHVALDGLFDDGIVRVRHHEVHQLDDGELRRRQLAAAQHGRTREIIALEVIEAEVHRGLVRIARLDLFGDDGLFHRVQPAHEVRQLLLRHAAQVQLHETGERQQALQAQAVAFDAVQREAEAVAREFAHAREQRVVRHDGRDDLQHRALAGQEGEDVAGEDFGVHVQEASGVADRAREAQLGRVGNDGGRRGQARLIGLALARTAEQELVAVQRLVAVEHRLAPQVEITHAQGVVRVVQARGGIGHHGLL
jgi:hypothetical protein